MPNKPDIPTDDHLAALTRAHAAILDEARAHIASARDPRSAALEERIRAAGARARKREPAETAAIGSAERKALQQLARLAAVHRARARVAQPLERPTSAAPAARARPALRTRPTISGNMDVRRGQIKGAEALSWDAAATVTSWEVRISERHDARADYVVRETLTLPATATMIELVLGELPLRVHVHGRRRDGRLARRALISGLTHETWATRWERRATAS